MKIRQLWNKLNNSKIFWMVFSLLASLIIWYNVKEESTDEIQRTFDIQVTYSGEDSLKDRDMVVTERYDGTVRIVVVGPKQVVNSLTADDISAQIDLNRVTQASSYTLQYSIKYPDGTDTSGLAVTSKSPETVNFTVSNWVTKTLEVRGSFDYALPAGYSCSGPTFEPSVITVSGPEIYVSELSHAFVSFGEEKVTSTYTVEAPVVLIDRDGNEYPTDNLELSNETVMATLEVKATKEVPLSVNLIYGGGASESNVKYTIEPEYIQLSGDTEILEGLNKLVLGTIDLREFDASMTQKFQILIDNGLTNDTGITEATVYVEITDPLETGSFTVTNFSCINATEGYQVTFVTQQLEVMLRGTQSDMENVTSANVRAVADLKDFNTTTGNVEVPVQIYVDGYTNVGTISDDYKITVQIRKVG